MQTEYHRILIYLNLFSMHLVQCRKYFKMAVMKIAYHISQRNNSLEINDTSFLSSLTWNAFSYIKLNWKVQILIGNLIYDLTWISSWSLEVHLVKKFIYIEIMWILWFIQFRCIVGHWLLIVIVVCGIINLRHVVRWGTRPYLNWVLTMPFLIFKH